MVQHYAKNNHFEYFAECTEAFFSSSRLASWLASTALSTGFPYARHLSRGCRFRNDYFPFVHEELKAYDKEVTSCGVLALSNCLGI